MRDVDELIDTLYKNHLESVAIENNDPDLETRFRKSMQRHYEEFAEEWTMNPVLGQMMLDESYKDELCYWSKLPNDSKYARFTLDPPFTELWCLSVKIHKVAERKHNGEMIDLAEKMHVKSDFDRMRSLRTDTILKGNEGRADWFISRSMMDTEYICSQTETESAHGSKISCRLRKPIGLLYRWINDLIKSTNEFQ